MPARRCAPTTAERVRSICVRGGGGLLGVERDAPVSTPIHHMLSDGSLAVAVPADRAPAANIACSARAPAVLELVDYAPLPLREPVRELVWIRGYLRRIPLPVVPPIVDLIANENPNPVPLQVETPTGRGNATHALLLLTIESLVVTDATGAESVAVADLLAARPDPFCRVESCLLRHLDAAHPEVLARLAAMLPKSLRRGQVRPLGLDRYGVRLRLEGDGGDRDVRVPFREPVDDLKGLSQAIRVLLGCPFANGLRARRV
ncbi:DUF2470 domain-containing protein [Mycobacterium sp. SM1]|uniref:DUF2470 domain-containing protein n=1 Tax=Mycobacterium sp. SM1 TaxID=2816243 RepID=UPI001BD0CD15|nr:DUF2470 domain-containing protein [Mycobacterium sp. SM1]MBS4728018.1 DUF2470 domain-containing protein [Mycobacterium sp. SM1]